MAEIKKSNFSVTCNLLSQYLKEKRRSFGDLGVLEFAPRPPEPTKGLYRPPTTLNLLPGIDVSTENQTDTNYDASVLDRKVTKERQQETAPLTIFYGGKVMIFDNFSPEKATDIMNLATKGSSASIPPAKPLNINASDIPMPIARRASLQVFLEKRKDRINSKAPYQVNDHPKMESFAMKPKEERSWLALGLEVSNMN